MLFSSAKPLAKKRQSCFWAKSRANIEKKGTPSHTGQQKCRRKLTAPGTLQSNEFYGIFPEVHLRNSCAIPSNTFKLSILGVDFTCRLKCFLANFVFLELLTNLTINWIYIKPIECEYNDLQFVTTKTRKYYNSSAIHVPYQYWLMERSGALLYDLKVNSCLLPVIPLFKHFF